MPMGGHSGQKSTLLHLCISFFWPYIRSDLTNWVWSCPICQVMKSPTSKPTGLLQPLPILDRIWEDHTMDFMVSLPSSSGYMNILVMVDCLTNGAHFIPLLSPLIAPAMARTFNKNVVEHHNVPRSIVSDRDCIFLSAFWKELFKLQGKNVLKHSTTYHSQSDGQTEVVNRCLQKYLRCFTMSKPS